MYSLDNLNHHLVLIEDRKFNCCQDNKSINAGDSLAGCCH